MATRNSLCKKTVDVEAGTVTFEFTNDQTVVFDLATLDEAGMKRAALHGISQKGGDSYAGLKSADEAQKSLVATLEAVEKGEWNTRTPGEPRIGVLVQALARAAGKTEEEAQAVVDSLDEETKKALAKDPAIKKAKAEIALEKASKAESEGESVLGGLF